MLEDSAFTDNQRFAKKRSPKNGVLASFAREPAHNTAPIVFPGRKLFKMNASVIKQRMVELARKYLRFIK
jgi:hypothetical protein